jgi:hypothetical protein
MDCVLQDLPSLIGVFRIHHHPVLKRIYLEIPLLLIAHFLPVSLFPIPKFNPYTQIETTQTTSSIIKIRAKRRP